MASAIQQSMLSAIRAYRYWRFKTDSAGSGGAGVSISEWKVTIDSSALTSLSGKAVTNLGSAFSPTYPLSNMTDGIAETINASNIAYNASAVDVYVDMGSTVSISAYNIAPQGNQNSLSLNNPLSITVYGSNDSSTWFEVASFTSISSGYPNWNPGTYRSFSF